VWRMNTCLGLQSHPTGKPMALLSWQTEMSMLLKDISCLCLCLCLIHKDARQVALPSVGGHRSLSHTDTGVCGILLVTLAKGK
jgi:hypothetical protein